MSSINVINIKHPSASGNAITLAADGSAFINTGALGIRNRIINGDMRIAQRGTSVTVTGAGATTAGWPVDRFLLDIGAAAGQATISQSTDTPTGQGYTNSLFYTVNTARTMLATEYTYIRQNIEGYNFADAMYGTASARQFTLSFWVKSSLTGTFGMYFGSAVNARMASATYTINAANTWEQKIVSVPVDSTVSASWLRDNNVGLQVAWSMGCGSSYRAAAGSWQSSLVLGAPGQVDVIATSGATFYLTGVQLEAGTVATAFERRPYGQELALCQRYFELGNLSGVMTNYIAGGYNLHIGFYLWKITKRAVPTVGTASVTNYQPGGGTGTASFGNLTTEGGKFDSGSTNQTFPTQFINGSVAFPISAEL